MIAPCVECTLSKARGGGLCQYCASLKPRGATKVSLETEEIVRRVRAEMAAADRQITDRIDRAAPYIDQNRAPGAWPASAKLKFLWLNAATVLELKLLGERGLNEGIERVNMTAAEINRLLDKAGRRFVDGYFADPFGEPVERRRG